MTRNTSALGDVVGDLTQHVRKSGLKMGFYYSGGHDRTFNLWPIEQAADYKAVKPRFVALMASTPTGSSKNSSGITTLHPLE